MTPEEKRGLENAFTQHKKDDERIIQKYTEIVQKDIILLMGEDLTSEDLGEKRYISYANIEMLLYDRLSKSSKCTKKNIEGIIFYTNSILKKMETDEMLEGTVRPCHGGIQYHLEQSYGLSEKGVEFFKQYLKEEKHKDALDLLRPF
ncbi:MAG: hypothetical protein KAS90_05025 [Candidatus Aenigmarchaeota archaeon]|nr:hypothetical protein [Candidatus Aenigmarchaeota archaeon]